MDYLLVFLILAALVLTALYKRCRRNDGEDWATQLFRPDELLFSEKVFRSARHGIVGKPDRGYLRNGTITLVELKTRTSHRVYSSDVIELSAQRLAVEAETGRQVSDTAYILTESTRDRSMRPQPVELLDRDEVLALRERRGRILRGEIDPSPARHGALCEKCAFRRECQSRHWQTQSTC